MSHPAQPHQQCLACVSEGQQQLSATISSKLQAVSNSQLQIQVSESIQAGHHTLQ